jgi:hypothetical protein
MKPFKKSKVARMTTCRKEYKIVTNPDMCEPYWDEGLTFYPRYRRGFKNPTKRIMSYQVRMYKTWKHNRKKQWKI